MNYLGKGKKLPQLIKRVKSQTYLFKKLVAFRCEDERRAARSIPFCTNRFPSLI